MQYCRPRLCPCNNQGLVSRQVVSVVGDERLGLAKGQDWRVSGREEVRIVYAVVKHVGTVPLPQLIVYVG